MLFIEDLGLRPTGRIRSDTKKPEYKRYYLAECTCGIRQEMFMSDFKRRPNSTCLSCSNKKNAATHGKSCTNLYTRYMAMKGRCSTTTGTDYEHYGARGITICQEWLDDFSVFEKWALENGYTEGLSIDRKNNNLGYSPDNCRWVEQTIQTRNTRVLRSTNTSGYRGVNWHKAQCKWSARITVKPTRIFLGLYSTALEAAKAYDSYVIANNLEHTTNGVLKKESI